MKLINFLFFFSALVIATPSQSSIHETVDNETEKPTSYHAPALTYDDIKDIPTHLAGEYALNIQD